MSAAPGLHLYLLLAGHVELRAIASVDKVAEPLAQAGKAGSLGVLADRQHEVAPALLISPSASGSPWGAAAAGQPPRCIKARVYFDGPVGEAFLAEFAAPCGLDLQADSALRALVDLIDHEIRQPRCGQPAFLARAGEMLFIALLRHLIAHPDGRAGLLGGLADPRLARALVAMHERPAWPWTLESMAAEAGMSRTAFANGFRQRMQLTPGHYLGQLRLAIARRVVADGLGLKQAAKMAGYASVSALSRALSRNSPQRWAKIPASPIRSTA